MLKQIPFYASLLEKDEKPTVGMVLVYGAVEAHSFGEKGCIASNETLAKECGLKEKTVANILSNLNKMGWIKVHLDEGNHRQLIEPLLIIDTPSRYKEPPFTVQGTPLPAAGNIEYSNKNTVIDNTFCEVEVLKTINTLLGRDFRVLPRGWKKTCKLFTLEEITTAFKNMLRDDWHSANMKHLKLDYLLRDTTIDKFRHSDAVEKKLKISTTMFPGMYVPTKIVEPVEKGDGKGLERYLEMRQKAGI